MKISTYHLLKDFYSLLNNFKKNFLYPRVHEPIRFKVAGNAERIAVVKVSFNEKKSLRVYFFGDGACGHVI